MNEATITAQEAGLRKSLSKAQVVMIGLGGAIGTGLFAGSALAIGYAGPAVLISYAIAGLIAVVMVLSLSEMAVVHPMAGSFGVYAELYINPWAGFVIRYTYWAAQVIAVGGEAVAVGAYMNFWFPDSPVWMWSVGFAFVLLYVNAHVRKELRLNRVLVLADQGRRYRRLHHHRPDARLRDRLHAGRFAQPRRAARRLHAATASTASG